MRRMGFEKADSLDFPVVSPSLSLFFLISPRLSVMSVSWRRDLRGHGL